MRASEHLAVAAWKHPRDYGGFSPDGDYCILSQHRESPCLDRSNWASACASLGAQPWDEGEMDGRPNVYHWRAGHWAFGWCEYLMVRADAPETILELAGEILCSLADYPILDESHFSEMEWDEAAKYWERMSVSDRLDYIRRADNGISPFAARHAYIPQGDDGGLFELLTQP